MSGSVVCVCVCMFAKKKYATEPYYRNQNIPNLYLYCLFRDWWRVFRPLVNSRGWPGIPYEYPSFILFPYYRFPYLYLFPYCFFLVAKKRYFNFRNFKAFFGSWRDLVMIDWYKNTFPHTFKNTFLSYIPPHYPNICKLRRNRGGGLLISKIWSYSSLSVRWEVLKTWMLTFFNIWLLGTLKMHHLRVLYKKKDSGGPRSPRFFFKIGPLNDAFSKS